VLKDSRRTKKRTWVRTRPIPIFTLHKTVQPSCRNLVETRTQYCLVDHKAMDKLRQEVLRETVLVAKHKQARNQAIVFSSLACLMQHKLTSRKTLPSSWISKTKLQVSAPTSAKSITSTWSRILTVMFGLSSDRRSKVAPRK